MTIHQLAAAMAAHVPQEPAPTLTPWSAFPGGWHCYWRLPDGRDVVAARVYRNGTRRWNAYLRDPEGRELPGLVLEDTGRKEALATVRAALEAGRST